MKIQDVTSSPKKCIVSVRRRWCERECKIKCTKDCWLSKQLVDEALQLSGWWFQIFFNFIPIWGNNPI